LIEANALPLSHIANRWGEEIQPEVNTTGQGEGRDQNHYDVSSKNIFGSTIAFYKVVD